MLVWKKTNKQTNKQTKKTTVRENVLQLAVSTMLYKIRVTCTEYNQVSGATS